MERVTRDPSSRRRRPPVFGIGAVACLSSLLAGCPDSGESPSSETGSSSSGEGSPSTSSQGTTDAMTSLDGGSTTTTGETTTGGATTGGTTDDTQGSSGGMPSECEPQSSSSSGGDESTAGSMCEPDQHEDNETEAAANVLGSIQDCDSDGAGFSGVLDGPCDVDWYRYSGSDVFPCVVDPTRSVIHEGPLRFCKFVSCSTDLNYLSCPNGTDEATSPSGRLGCCGSGGFGLGPTQFDCNGVDDDATIYLRLDQAGAECVDYTVSYHY